MCNFFSFFIRSSISRKETDDEKSRTFETNDRKLITERSRKRVTVSNFIFRQFLGRNCCCRSCTRRVSIDLEDSIPFLSLDRQRIEQSAVPIEDRCKIICIHNQFTVANIPHRSRDYSCILSDDNSLTCASWFEIRLPRPGQKASDFDRIVSVLSCKVDSNQKTEPFV